MIFWYVLFSSTLFGYLANKDNFESKNLVKSIFYFSCIFILIIFAGLRKGIGDTKLYKHLFDLLKYNPIRTFLTENNDPGFMAYASFIKTYISSNSQVFIFISAAFTLILITITFYKYSRDFGLSIFLFISFGNYIVMMNGVRQYLVAAVIFICFPLIYKRKWYIYFPVVIAMSTMHQSALIFILLYFLVNNEAWSKTTYVLIGLGIGLYLTYPISGPIIANALNTTKYGHYSEMLVSGSGGANIIRALVSCVPVILSFVGKKSMSTNEKHYNVILHMSILNAISMILSTKYWIYARYSIYFSVYSIILLCWCLKYIFKDKEKIFTYYSCILLYGIFYWYEMTNMGIVYISDYF